MASFFAALCCMDANTAAPCALPPLTSGGESAAHRELKRLSLAWAQARGFRIAATEVSLPTHRYRLDVAACRVERRSGSIKLSTGSPLTTAIFECKASREDYRRDARTLATIVTRLQSIRMPTGASFMMGE